MLRVGKLAGAHQAKQEKNVLSPENSGFVK
jgi:hypothetical protein